MVYVYFGGPVDNLIPLIVLHFFATENVNMGFLGSSDIYHAAAG